MGLANLTHEDDAALAERMAQEPQAFAQLYDRYFGRVYNYLRYRCEDAAQADDLVAQTFERAWARRDSYKPKRGSFPAWLFAIARNAMNDFLRAKRRRPEAPLEAAGQYPAQTASPEQVVLQNEMVAGLLEALSGLDERQRDLLALKFAARMNNRQIAQMTGLSESNVGVIVFRAIRKLRAELSDDFVEPSVGRQAEEE